MITEELDHKQMSKTLAKPVQLQYKGLKDRTYERSKNKDTTESYHVKSTHIRRNKQACQLGWLLEQYCDIHFFEVHSEELKDERCHVIPYMTQWSRNFPSNIAKGRRDWE